MNSVAGCDPTFNIYRSYITLEDLRIKTSTNNPTCDHVTAADSDITAWEDPIVPNINGSPSTGSVGFVARGLYIDAGKGIGIKVRQDFSLVENSEVHNTLETFNCNATIFRNNVLYGADQYGSTITSKGGSRNIQIYNNIVHMTSSSWTEGLVLGGTSGPQWDYDPSTGIECYNCAAWNNVVINETGTYRDVLLMAGCKDCVMANNIGINGSISMRWGGGATQTAINAVWKNNILTCRGGKAIGQWWNTSGSLTVDANNFFNCSGVPSQAHALSSDPLFLNATSDWHVQSASPVIGAGTEVIVPGYNAPNIDVSRDRDGKVRATPWNLGLY